MVLDVKSTEQKKIVTIVSPFYNEEDGVHRFCQEVRSVIDQLKQYNFNVICVNDGSADKTLALLIEQTKKDKRFFAISLSRNFGHQAALYAGITSALPDSDVVITLDSDLQHPPNLIPSLLEKWEDGFEIVSTVRQCTDGIGFFKRLSSKAFYKVISALSDTSIPDGCGDFCLYDKKVADVIRSFEERAIFLRGIASWVGFKRYFIPFNAPTRAIGQTKYTLKKMVQLAFDGYFSFSINPIRICLKLGIVFCITSFVYLLYALFIFSKDGTVRGWMSLLAVIVLFGGMNLFTMGLIGEYIGRTFEETKRRPRFIISYKSF
jgi:dolichol-phosphate mannosyltransferase